MADEKFKLPQSSYEELTKIIKGYGHITVPARLDEVSKLTSLNTTIVSRNTGFLIAIDLLNPGSKKMPSALGTQLAHALEHNMVDDIRACWRRIIQENDFLSKLITSIKIRNGMDQQTLEAHIAYSAGQPKKPQFMTGARTVIDILKAAEFIKEVDGKFIPDDVTTAPTDVTQPPILSATSTINVGSPKPKEKDAFLPPTILEYGKHQFRINININCTPADIEELGEKIKIMIEKITNIQESISIDDSESV